MALANGTPKRIERPFVSGDQIMFGAMGVNSCVKDLRISLHSTPRHCGLVSIS
jgi:hypothetical protein